MTSGLPHARLVGHVSAVSGNSIHLTAPHAAHPASSYVGDPNPRGTVGEFLVVQTGDQQLLARLTSVELNPKEAVRADWIPGAEVPETPMASAVLLATIQGDGQLVPGVATMPRLGNPVFSASGKILSQGIGPSAPGILLGNLSQHSNIAVAVDPAAMFGRHMAVLGSTGGGKSWTVARVAEEIEQAGGRMLLLDATGEYHTLGLLAQHVRAGATTAALPVHELTDADRRLLFRPS